MGFIKRDTQKCEYSDRFTQYISIAANKRGPCAYIYSHKDFIYSFRNIMKKKEPKMKNCYGKEEKKWKNT